MIKRNEFIMFIKTTDSNLVNLDALAAIKIDGFSIIARGLNAFPTVSPRGDSGYQSCI